MAQPVRLDELRVLDGPNLYFPRPAVKLTMSVPGWLNASEGRVRSIAAGAGINDPKGPGGPKSEQRRRYVARLAVHLTRRLGASAGTRLAVRARSGPEAQQIVVAFPWRRRNAAEALGREVATLLTHLLTSRRSPTGLIEEAGRRLAAAEPGPAPAVPRPDIPVISISGTNGKTTTVRLLAHIVRSAGRSVAYSSTDGVYRDDDALVEAGDYSGFGGAGMALAQDPDVAVLETARGGILLRGVGVLRNDVAVVTNVSEDHLDLHGIRTLDQLAEVKAAITRITKPAGWCVLNADDPRVLAMRRRATGRPWLFSLDPDHAALRESLAEGGRAITVFDGWLVVLSDARIRPLVPLIDVPVTFAGISGHNIQNAMAATAAALGIGLPERAVVRGLKTFVMDPERNPGRTNLFRLGGSIVVVDYAHNEAGMTGLVELCNGLRRKGGEVWIAICTAGDRTDRVLHRFACTAARGSDHISVAELERYLRGRASEDIVHRLVAGAEDGGAGRVPVYPDELRALKGMLAAATPRDVVAVTALGQRPEIFAYLKRRRAARLSPADVRKLARSAAASLAQPPTSLHRA